MKGFLGTCNLFQRLRTYDKDEKYCLKECASVSMCVCVCVRVCIYVRALLCLCVYVGVRARVCISVCMLCTGVYACVFNGCVGVYACMNAASLCVCVCVCVSAYVCGLAGV